MWHRILSPSPEKNEEWLHRTTMAFTARLDAKKVAGKTPKLRGGAAAQFRDADPGQVYQLACLWVHLRPEVQTSVDVSVFQRLEGMFRRGALDRELLEKVKVRDPQVTLSSFRFMMSAQQDMPAQVSHASQLTMSSAELAVKKANFNLWKATLENEGKRFSIFQQHQRRVLEAWHQPAVCSCRCAWRRCAVCSGTGGAWAAASGKHPDGPHIPRDLAQHGLEPHGGALGAVLSSA